MQVKNLYALEVQDACKSLSSKKKARDIMVERESELPLNMKPQNKPSKQLQEVVE